MSDKELLDYLENWIAENKAKGIHHFGFFFDTSASAREQIEEDYKAVMEDSIENEVGEE